MAECGIDISKKQTKAVNDLLRLGKRYDAVVTVCDAATAERCPLFPGKTRWINWSFPDPSDFTGTQAQIMTQIREVREAIRQKVAASIGETDNKIS